MEEVAIVQPDKLFFEIHLTDSFVSEVRLTRLHLENLIERLLETRVFYISSFEGSVFLKEEVSGLKLIEVEVAVKCSSSCHI